MAPQLNSAKRRRVLLDSVKRTSGRRLKVNTADKETHYYVCDPKYCRNIVKEYGDITTYPCGAQCVIDSHFSNGRCLECDAVRFILDTWSLENARKASEEKREPDAVPPLTHEILLAIIKSLDFTPEDVLRLPDTWNPYQRMSKRSSIISDELIYSRCSIVEYYERHSEKRLHKRGKRPPFELGDFNPQADDPIEAALHQRVENTKNEMMQHIILTAIADGRINQMYLNMVMYNYGICGPNQQDIKDLQQASGINVTELYEKFQLRRERNTTQREVNMEHYKYSPLNMMYISRYRDIHYDIPHPYQARMKAFKTPNNKSDENAQNHRMRLSAQENRELDPDENGQTNHVGQNDPNQNSGQNNNGIAPDPKSGQNNNGIERDAHNQNNQNNHVDQNDPNQSGENNNGNAVTPPHTPH